MTFKLGLTGSIGMGKSTTAQMFAELGCALWDADAAVHRMYASGGAAVAQIQAAFPSAVQDNTVSRDALKQLIQQDPAVLKKLEAIVHPLVAKDRADFIKSTTSDIVVLDIPLLFELGSEKTMDAVVCVSIPAEIQQNRVLERGTMTAQQFETIRENQMSNDDKCARSDYVVITDTVAHAKQQVQQIVSQIRGQLAHA
ncbi:dephospho-CoA kinase [Cognatishimia sp. WU-CL00825]|uniref:dephospho-CoA kinase n=1 Tax=Cognatishimia sp. WU-CL00825 TaxID=3127658 RepID=UPI00310449CC